jgi:uncharacterized membrane protein
LGKSGVAEKQSHLLDPAKFFLMVGLLVGVLYCVAIPYGAGFDEERHLVRIYYMSQFQFMPNFPNPKIHEDVFDLSYQRRLVQTPAFDMFNPENFGRRFSTFDQLRYGQRTQSIYSPVIFLPQALIGRWLWWKYDFPILPTIILQRLAGLLIYIAGGYAAIRVVPYGRWIFTAVALLPAALYQASTLNADGFTAAVSFAFIAWVLAVYVNERDGVQTRSIWTLVALSLLLGFAKPGAIVLLPLLLLLVRHPYPSRAGKLLLVAGALLAIVANVGWWMIATPGSVFSGGGVQSLSQQSSLIFVEPLRFIKLLLQAMILTFPDQVLGLMAGYGYGAGQVPGPVYFFAALGLLAAFLAEPRRVLIPVRTRIFLAVFFLFCSAAIYTVAFLPNYVTGGILALAKHGRYYIPFVPLFFLSVCGLVILRGNMPGLAQFIVIGSVLFSIGFYSFGIYAAYYTYCGYEAYTGATCTLPVYKNLEKEDAYTAAIYDGVPVSQTFTSQCSNLELVQVYVKSVPAGSAGSLRVALLDENHHIIASREIPTNEIIIEDYLPLPVTPPHGERNGNYEIKLDSVGLSPAEEIDVLLTRTDYYPGQLVVNGAATRSDLLIHYTCTDP